MATTTEQDIFKKISVENEELSHSNATLLGQLATLTAQIKVDTDIIQEMDSKNCTMKKTSWTVCIYYNLGTYCWMHVYKLHFDHNSNN